MKKLVHVITIIDGSVNDITTFTADRTDDADDPFA